MARILMAWELGTGLGHLSTLLALAKPLISAGHDIAFAVRDPGHATPFLESAGVPIFQCPINPGVLSGKIQLYSLPQILLSIGYANESALKGRIDAWRSFYKLWNPDIVVCDASPTALLAARSLQIRTVRVGTAFFMPPDTSPLPPLRPWLKLDHKILIRNETALLNIVNNVMHKYSGSIELKNAAQIFHSDLSVTLTVKEMDFYAALREPDMKYWGPAPATHGHAVNWPDVTGKRIFVYLRNFSTLPSLLDTLQSSGQNVLLYIPDLPATIRKKFAGGNLRFEDKSLDMMKVLQECDLVVLHGGHGATCAALLAGKPMLLLPIHLEMLLNSRAVARIGAGLVAPQRKPAGMQQKFEQLINTPDFARKASTFSAGYAHLDVATIPDRVARLIAS